MMQAVAAVQPGYGNPAPLQLDLDPGLTCDEEAVDLLEALLLTYFDLGGTLVNINVLDRQTLLEACADPSRHPDLIVRVTGFSAYFASLSSEMRHYVLERIV
jgi:formate C-acetyltransferase